MTTRRQFLKALAVTGMTVASCSKFDYKRPNVVLLITDDQGYGDLECHGNPHIKTPTLDRLHRESIRLTNFHVGPTCAPTRASLMTGRYCNRTGVWHTVMGRSLLLDDEQTMADIFKSNGYATGLFGKWHLGDSYPFRPSDRGFDTAVHHGGGGIGQAPDVWNNDYFDDSYWVNGTITPFDGYCTDVWFAQASAFIRQHKNQPFLCYLTTNAPHGPFHVAETYSEPYRLQGVPDTRAQFYGMITNIDENVARLRSLLTDLGLVNDTIFIYMTDNGTSAGCDTDNQQFLRDGYNAGMRGKKVSEYDGGHRVPCFMHWPRAGWTTGRDISRLTAHIDLLPTLVDLCSLKVKDNLPFDGTSLKPLLQGEQDWPDRVLITDSQRIEYPEKWRKSAVMTDRWRLVNGTELYDMIVDPGQISDVSADFPAVVAELKNAYEAWWADISTRFDQYAEIVIGETDEPVRLTSHDWHGVERNGQTHSEDGKEFNPPWHQSHIRDGDLANGFWAIRVAQAATYRFQLFRWPPEIHQPLNAAVPFKPPVPGGAGLSAGKPLDILRARLAIADVDLTLDVNPREPFASFQVNLQPCRTSLKTWFTEKGGTSFGAFYVIISKVQTQKGLS